MSLCTTLPFISTHVLHTSPSGIYHGNELTRLTRLATTTSVRSRFVGIFSHSPFSLSSRTKSSGNLPAACRSSDQVYLPTYYLHTYIPSIIHIYPLGSPLFVWQLISYPALLEGITYLHLPTISLSLWAGIGFVLYLNHTSPYTHLAREPCVDYPGSQYLLRQSIEA